MITRKPHHKRIGPQTYQAAIEKRKGKPRRYGLGRAAQPLKRGKRLSAGKKVKAWNAERRRLKIEHERMGIKTCELRGVIEHQCTYDNFLRYAHDAKRRKLSAEDLKIAILICNNVHDLLERMPPDEMKRIVNDTIAARKRAV